MPSHVFSRKEELDKTSQESAQSLMAPGSAKETFRINPNVAANLLSFFSFYLEKKGESDISL